MNKTEVKDNIWLVGDTISSFNLTKLPLALDVLKLFFHHQRIGRETIEGSAKRVAKEIERVWSETAIPMLLSRNIILKIESLKKKYETLKKSRFRRTEIQFKREAEFQEVLNAIFDVTSQAGLLLSKEQQNFLEDQRGFRQLEICSLKPLAGPLIFPKLLGTSDSESDESSQNESEGSDFEDSLQAQHRNDLNAPCPRSQILKTILNSTDVTSALDRVNITDGKFTIIAASIARALRININKTTLSRSTVTRKRDHNRKIIVDDVKQDFFSLLEQDTFGLMIHFDGKMLSNYTAENHADRTSKIDRIAIVVTGHNIEQLLGVVKAEDGKGATIAEAANRMLSEWDEWNQTKGKNKAIKIRDRIIGMVFDTTSSNTGHLIGACKLFEELYMKRKLLHFACRHHVFEVIVGGIFKKLFGDSEGPNVAIFQRFKAEWKKINKKKFKILEKTYFKKRFAESQRKETIEFLLHVLSSETAYVPRDDSKELMELCLLVLGHPLENFTFKTPGPTHHARWMSKIIYSFKIFLFRNQFKLSPKEKSNFKEMCLFASLIYVKAWIECPLASEAPANDLNFFKKLKEYAVVSKIVSTTAITKFKNHLWYLGPELVVLSLFSNKVSPKEKLEILKNMKKNEDVWNLRGIRLKDTRSLHKKKLCDLIGYQSMNAINCLQLNIDFMHNLEPEKWPDPKDYKIAKSFVDDIDVINDAAERALALMTIYNDTLARKEDKKQLILQVVQDNRKRIKGCKKKTLLTYEMR